jgi:hypothetical protein
LIPRAGGPTLGDMRIASLCALALTLACSSSPEDSSMSSGGSAGSGASAGGVGGTSSAGSGAAGLAQGSGGAGAPSAGAGAGNATGGGAGAGNAGSGGVVGGAGSSSGGSGGRGGAANGGAGGANGGAGGASGGTGGSGACVKNLACKLSPPPTTGDIYQDCVDRINQFLTQCACLPALARRKDGEACADQMAEYDASMNMAHAGIRAKICQPGGSQNECPGYSSNSQVIGLCMQQMWDEGPPPTATCTDACYEEHGHFINMTDPNVKQVACGFFTTASGKVWAVQNFSR